MSLVSEATLKKVADHLPANVRSLAKAVYRRHRHWAHPAMKKFGTVQDLYYWVADGNLGTLLLLQNYFSVLYPALNTETGGDIYLYNKDGEPLGSVPFSVAHCSCARFRLSSLLEELQVSPEGAYGTLEVNIAIPREVLDHIQGQNGVYFWDRFYIGYTNAKGQTCFVHGVDKTHIFRDGKSDPVANWYKSPQDRQWAPEIPIDIDDYKKLKIDSFVERPVRDGPWSARGSGREAPRAAGSWPHRPWGCAQDKQDPVQYSFRGSGRPMEVMERGPHAAATAGTVPASG